MLSKFLPLRTKKEKKEKEKERKKERQKKKKKKGNVCFISEFKYSRY